MLRGLLSPRSSQTSSENEQSGSASILERIGSTLEQITARLDRLEQAGQQQPMETLAAAAAAASLPEQQHIHEHSGDERQMAAGQLNFDEAGIQQQQQLDQHQHSLPPAPVATAPRAALSGGLQGAVGGWSGGSTAVRLAATAREDSTMDSYGRHWQTFAGWCAANG